MDTEKNGSNSGLLNIGPRLEKLRIFRGMTQRMLAEAADCSIATLNRIEQGRGGDGISSAYMVAWCNLLRCSIDWMLTGHGPDPFYEGKPLDGVIGPTKPDEFELMRVTGLDNERNLRYVLLTCDVLRYYRDYRAGDIIVVDVNDRPGRGEEFAAMVDGEVKLMRLGNEVGSTIFAELHDGTNQLFDPDKTAWFGAICGTLRSTKLKIAKA